MIFGQSFCKVVFYIFKIVEAEMQSDIYRFE